MLSGRFVACFFFLHAAADDEEDSASLRFHQSYLESENSAGLNDGVSYFGNCI